MPIGTCDPASRGQTWNDGEQAFGDAGTLTYRYGWDGVSTRDSAIGCVGPLDRVTVNNGNAQTWYAHFQGRRGTWLRLDMPPGFVQSYNAGQLGSRGFDDNTDLENLTITTDPNPQT